MTTSEQIVRTARAGAASVYEFVARRAEHAGDGVRWQTLSWRNEPQYNLSVLYGVAGIPFFLVDYYRLTGTQGALDLAVGGARWCSSPERTFDPDDEWLQYGLVRGIAGVGMAWLRIYNVTQDKDALTQAAAVGDRLLQKAPGPVTDWLDGAAGEGAYLLRLAEAAKDERFLQGAIRTGRWLADVAVRDQQGLYWPWQVGDPEHSDWFGLSFIPGSAGNAHFLLSLYRATREQRFADVAREAGETLLRQAAPDHGGLNWPDTLDGFQRGEPRKCQWCYGASGVGIFFVKAYEVLGEQRYRETAEAAGECTYQYGDVRRSAVQCHGLAGNAELFLDLYRATRDRRWLDRAHDFAERMFAHRRETPQGDEWQADDAGYYSPEFMLGASGTGHFFLRLWRPEDIDRPLL